MAWYWWVSLIVVSGGAIICLVMSTLPRGGNRKPVLCAHCSSEEGMMFGGAIYGKCVKCGIRKTPDTAQRLCNHCSAKHQLCYVCGNRVL